MTRTNAGFVKIIMVLIIAALTIVGAVFAIVNWDKPRVVEVAAPEALINAEKTLANDEIVILAYADVETIVALEESSHGEPDKNPLRSLEQNGLIAELENSGFNPRKAITKVLYSLHLKGEEEFSTIVLFGTFPPDRIISFLKAEYDAIEWDSGNGIVYDLQGIDPDRCKDHPRAVHVTDGRIVIGSSKESLATVLGWFESKPSDDRLVNWREYREGKLASAAIFNPGNVHRSADGIEGKMLQDITEELGPVQAIFFSVAPSQPASGLMFELLLESDDMNWIAATTDKWQSAIDESRTKMAKRLSSVDALYDALSIRADEFGLRASLVINSKTWDKLIRVAQEVLDDIFGFKFPIEADGEGQPAEQIDEEPLAFLPKYSKSNLKPFNNEFDSSFEPKWSMGPFAVQVTSIGLDDNSRLEIGLQATGQNIQNLGKKPGADLTIASITSAEGDEIMRIDRCGLGRKQVSADFTSGFPGSYFKDGEVIKYQKIEASKKVSIVEGVELGDIRRIEGVINLRLPVSTESILLPVPLSERIIEKHGTRIFIQSVEKGSISYDQSGDYDAVLAVRALNRDKKYLQAGGHSSSDRLFAHGRSFNRSFRGEIAYIEIVFARKLLDLEYPFAVADVMPGFGEEGIDSVSPPIRYTTQEFKREFSTIKTPVVEKQYDWDDLPKAVFRAGPLNLLLKDYSDSGIFAGRASLEVQAPLVPGLDLNLSGVEIAVKEVEFGDGSVEQLSAGSFLELTRNSHFPSGNFNPENEQKYLSDKTSIPIEPRAGDNPVSAISGTLKLRFPKVFKSARFDAPALGKKTSFGPFKAHLSAIGSSSLTIKAEGPRETVIRIQALNKKGNPIGRAMSIDVQDDGEWSAMIHNIAGKPESVEVIYATEQDFIEYPFKLEFE